MGADSVRPVRLATAKAPFKVILKREGVAIREIECASVYEAMDQATTAASSSIGGESIEIVNSADMRERVWGSK